MEKYLDDVGVAELAKKIKTELDKKTQINDNFLINSYFVGGGSQLGVGHFPINRNGKTVYNNPSSSIWGMDCFLNENKYGTITLEETGVTFSASGGTAVFLQNSRRYEFDVIKGREITLSILTTDNKLYSGTSILGNQEENKGFCTIIGPDGWNCTIVPFPNHGLQTFRLAVSNGKSVSLVAAKLEPGPSQTLAHKEGDTWVLNTIPDYMEEYLKCSQYSSANGTWVGPQSIIRYGTAVPSSLAEGTVFFQYM